MATGLIPSKVDNCNLKIFVSDVNCKPSKKLSEQIAAVHTDFDKGRLASGGYTLLTIKYTSPDSISGFQFEIEIPKYHSRIAAVGTKIGSLSSQSSQCNDKGFIVFNSKNTVLGIFNPEIDGSSTSTSYNLASQTDDTVLCYVLLEQSLSVNNQNYCPEEINIKNVKAVKNLDGSNNSLLVSPKANWKGKVSKETGFSDIYLAGKLLSTKTYNNFLDADNDGTIDILDVVTLANKKHNLLYDSSNTSVMPKYVCEDHKEFVTKSDLNARLEILSANIVKNNKNDLLYDLDIVFGLQSTNSIAGIQFDFGRDIFDNGHKEETLTFLGSLSNLEKDWAYKFENFSDRFNRDKITRFFVYQLPLDVTDVQLKDDLTKTEQVLSYNSLEPLRNVEPILKYSIKGCDLKGDDAPAPRYYYADEIASNVQDKKELKKVNNKKGDRYYGPVNLTNGQYYTGNSFSPNTSRRLTAKWDVFELINERIVTNDFLNYFDHDSQGLKYSGFDLAYDVNQTILREKFDNNLVTYFNYLINYLYMPLRKGLNSNLSEYHYEPSRSVNSLHDGFVSDANLDGNHGIADTVSLVNIATQKLSTSKVDTQGILKVLGKSENKLSYRDVADSSTRTSLCEDTNEVKYNLRSLSKIVPTYVLNNFTTTTFPHILPSIKDQKTEGTIIYFSDRNDVSGSNQPAEFKNWSEYFYDVHNVKYYQVPEENDYSFVKVNLATNTSKIQFIQSVEFMIDFNNAYDSLSNKKFWVYPGDGFSTSSYSLTVRASSSSGSILDNTGSYISGDGKLHFKLDVSGSSLATPITYDGGYLNLIKLYYSSLPDYESGKYIGFTTTPQTGALESVGLPLDRSGSVEYVKHTTADRLVFGPSSSYLSQQYEDNSSSPQVFGDALLHTRVVGPSTIDVEYVTLKPFNTASFEFRAIDGIEVTIDSNYYYPSQSGYTASITSDYEKDGITGINFYAPTGTVLTGSGNLLRLKTNRLLYPQEILENGKELVCPPRDTTNDLIIPNVNLNEVFPSINGLKFYLDSNVLDYFETQASSSYTVVKKAANPYGDANLKQDTLSSMPVLTTSSSGFKSDIRHISFNNTASLQLLTSSLGYSEIDTVNYEKFTFITAFEPLSMEGDWTKTLLKVTSSNNTFTIDLKGITTVGPDGAISVTTSGSSGGEQTINMPFEDSGYTGARTNLLVITSDGSDNSTSATKIKLNGVLVSTGSSTLTSSEVPTKYVFGGDGSDHANHYYGNVGEIMVFNTILSDEEITIFEGYLAHKWLTNSTSSLPSSHTYYNTKPITSNTTTNNSATDAAITKQRDFYPGSGSMSSRSSALMVSKRSGLANITIASGSDSFTIPDYDNFRELPREINQETVVDTDNDVYVNKYDPKTGILEIAYKSEKVVDGYWLKLGNTVESVKKTSKTVGIVDIDKKDQVSQCSLKDWSQYVGYGPDELSVYNKDPKISKNIKQIAFGFSQGRIAKNSNSRKDFYRPSGSWGLPSTPKDESQILTRLVVDPKSFNGIPTISSYRLVTNDKSTTPDAAWTGDKSGGVVGYDDLNNVIEYVKYGFFNSGSSDSTIASEAVKFDSEGDDGNLDIVDVLAVFNHLVLSQGEAATNSSLKVVPQDCATSLVTAPGTISLSATGSSCASGSFITLNWTTGSGGTPLGYEIWRKGNDSTSNKRKRNLNYLFTDVRERLYRDTADDYKKVKVISGSNNSSYIDYEAPYNVNCCSDSDNPEVEYLIISFNAGGESSGISNKVTLNCCNEVPVARDVVRTSSINTPVTFVVDVTENSAAPPFGTASVDTEDPTVLKFSILGASNGKFDKLSNNDGQFTFKPNRDFLGCTTMKYEVVNDSGCSATASITIHVKPSKFTPVVKSAKKMVNENETINNIVKWNRNDVRGKILKYDIYRAVSGSSYSSTPIKTLSGKLPVTEDTVKYYDPIVPGSASVVYKYKIAATGFYGDPDTAISEGRACTTETDDVEVTVFGRITGSNPVVTLSASQYLDSDHPRAKLTWSNVTSSNGRDAQYYKVYRLLVGRGDRNYRLHDEGLINYDGSSTYTFYDDLLPAPNLTAYGLVDYTARYRVTSVFDDGENGNPNVAWTGQTSEANISGSGATPFANDKTFSFCADTPLTGTVTDLVYNHAPSYTTYSATSLSGLSFNSDGTFNYLQSTPGSYSFNYSASYGGGKYVSDTATITLRVLDCTDLACPDGTDAQHIICDNYTIQSQRTKTVDQVPFGLKEKTGENLRGKQKAYAVSKGEIDTSDD